MTAPLSNKLQVKGYAGAHAGIIENPIGERYSNIGVNVGANLNYKNTYLNGELQGGTAFGAKVKLGHEFNLGKNIGLDTYGIASINKSDDLMSDSRNIHYHGDCYFESDPPYSYDETFKIDSKWTSGEKKLGAGTQLTFKAKNVKFGVGLEAGTRSTLQNKDLKVQAPTRDIEINVANYETGEEEHAKMHFEYSDNLNVYKKTGYITGTAFADAKVSKHINLFAKGALNQGVEAGFKWTF